MTERDNYKRITQSLPEMEAPSLEIPKEKNPLQFWNNSTEYVELPSGGEFYKTIPGKIEIKEMTAYHEDILSNRNYILEGVLFDKFIEAICVDSIDPKDLLSGDRRAILLAARATAYGDEYVSKVKCPACGQTNDIKAKLSFPNLETEEDGNLKVNKGVLDSDIRSLLNASYDVGNRTVKFELQDSIEVVCKLSTGALEKEIHDYGIFKKKHGYGELTSADNMSKIIVSINGVNDRSEIESLCKKMPAHVAKYWRNAYKQLNPTVDIGINQQCSNNYCDNIIEQEVGLSPEFFWPKS